MSTVKAAKADLDTLLTAMKGSVKSRNAANGRAGGSRTTTTNLTAASTKNRDLISRLIIAVLNCFMADFEGMVENAFVRHMDVMFEMINKLSVALTARHPEEDDDDEDEDEDDEEEVKGRSQQQAPLPLRKRKQSQPQQHQQHQQHQQQNSVPQPSTSKSVGTMTTAASESEDKESSYVHVAPPPPPKKSKVGSDFSSSQEMPPGMPLL